MKRLLCKYCLVYLFLAPSITTFCQQPVFVDSLETVVKSLSDTQKVVVLNRLTDYYHDRTPEKALKYANEAVKLAKELKFTAGLTAALENTGNIYEMQGDYRKALSYYFKALKLIENTNYPKEKNSIYIDIGNAYQKLGYTEQALDYFQKSLAIAEESNNKNGVGTALHNLANLYGVMGKYNMEIEYSLKAAKYFEETGYKKGVAYALSNVGISYYRQKKYEKVIVYFNKTIAILKEINDKPGLGKMLNNIGDIYHSLDNEKKAMTCYQEAAKISEEIGDKSTLAAVIHNIGSIYYKQEDYDQSLEYMLRSLKIKEETGYKKGMTLTLNSIGRILSAQKNYSEAIAYYRKSLAIAKEIDYKQQVKNNYKNLAETYVKLNNYKKGYHYFELYSNVKDSIYNESSAKQITEMQTKYETEKSEKEIELLNKQQLLDKEELARKDAESKKQKAIMYFVICILVLSIIFGVVLYNRFRIIRKQKNIIAEQKRIVDEKNKDITDSINYAKNIQEAILPKESEISNLLPYHFIFFVPKDIVSGDFYWFAEKRNKVFIAACDCTGHGVPGAFVSMVGNNLLNQIILEKGIEKPGEILSMLNRGVKSVFTRKGDEQGAQDGMDIALCVFDIDEKEKFIKRLGFAGAQNPLLLIRNGEILITTGDRKPIGGTTKSDYSFTNHNIEIQKGDMVYLFSDGYIDQFGGDKGKKYMIKNFKELLLSIHMKSMTGQRDALRTAMEEWKGEAEQVDDILVIGVRV